MASDTSVASTRALRRANAEAMLRYALSQDAFNASDAMDGTGLTRSTVIGLCDELVELGWLDKLDDARTAGEYSKGRPARRFRLRAGAGVVVGLDAGQHGLTALAADLHGTTLARVRRSFGEADRDPVHRVTVITAAIDAVLAEIGRSKDAVLVTVFGIPAPTDDEGRSPSGGDGYWLDMNPDLVGTFSDHGRIVVENDANLAATAEGALGAGRGTRSFAALLSGERFGAGIIVDGALVRGRHGGAGEMRVLEFVEGVGSAEGLASLAREWAREGGVAAGGPGSSGSGFAGAGSSGVGLVAAPTAEDVFESADRGDALSLAIVDRLGDRLARVCFVLASLLDVERVIVSGAIAAAAETVVAKASRVLENDSYQPVPEIVASSLGADVVVLGAIQRGLALVREAPLSYTPAAAI
jgi:predicted NBD/HSP70 family sugar kinase